MNAIHIASDLCREFEGLRLKTYLCPAGVWTIGYGATGPDVQPGVVWTKEQAEDRLQADLARFAAGVARLTPNVLVDDNKYAAIIDFAFNLGLGRLQASTLRRAIAAKNWKWAQQELLRWDKGRNPKTGMLESLPGLTRRRVAETKLLML